MEQKKSIKDMRMNKKAVLIRFVVLLLIFVIVGMATRMIPQGVYERVKEGGNTVIVDGSFQFLDNDPLPVWRWFTAPFEALASSSGVTFIIIILMLLAMGGIMVVLDESQIMLYIVSAVIEKFGTQKYKLMYILTAVMMVMGSTVSFYDQCGIFIPLALGLAFAAGWDSLVGIGLSFLPIAMGFAVCTINPIVIGIPQTIAGLPINSGLWLRVILLVVMYFLYVTWIVKYAKKIEADPSKSLSAKSDEQIRAMFPANSDPEVLKNRKIKRGVILFACAIAVIFLYTFASMVVTSLSAIAMPVMLVFLLLGTFVGAMAAGTMKFGQVLKGMLNGAKITLPAALVIFLIAGIRQIVINGEIMDTLLYYCYESIQGTSPYVAIFLVLGITMAMEFIIGSASAKAFLLLPLLLPLGNMVGLTSQTIAQAYIFGDGFCNAFYPTSNMVMLITGTIGISFGTWYRFTGKLILRIALLVAVSLIFCVAIGYGPF